MTEVPADPVAFRILGPVTFRRDGVEHRVAADKPRTLLATLLLNAPRTTPVGDIVDRVWSTRPPRDARATVHTYVGRLRRLVGAKVIRTDAGGYAAVLDADELDLTRFDRLAERAASTGDPGREAELLRAAVGLWRGPALADVRSEVVERIDVPPIEERRLAVLQQLIELDLAAGRGQQHIPALRALVEQHPLREPAWAQLMLALAGAGRQGEALRVYDQVRRHLVEELGVDPGPDLRQAHVRVLGGGTEPPADGPPAAPPPVPFQLPPDVRGFVGRAAELSSLDRLLRSLRQDRPGPAVASIGGMAGVGKSALAVHWAHRVRAAFPDGQVFLPLRGASGDPVGPVAALTRLVRSIDDDADPPSDVDALVARYRTLTGSRQLLVLLDDAAGAEQVRPLLPTGPRTVTLVTGRADLRGLVALDGARPYRLEMLDASTGTALLAEILGADRVAADPGSASALVALCGGLPLALRITAADLATAPERPLAAQVLRLRDRPLDALDIAGDRAASARAAFRTSYDRLPPSVRRLFRLLGGAPGDDIGRDAATALDGRAANLVGADLDVLVAAHLVHCPGPGRYAMHDLVRHFAAELGDDPGHAAEIAPGRVRLYRAVCADVLAAAGLIAPDIVALPRSGAPAAAAGRFADGAGARAWLDLEIANLSAVVRQIADGPPPRKLAWLLADGLRGYLWQARDRVHWSALATAALAAARSEKDPHGVAAMRLSLGDLALTNGDLDTALAEYRAGLACAREAGWPAGEAGLHGQAGVVLHELGRAQESRAQHELALDLNRRLGRRGGEAACLGNLGVVSEELGDLRDAAGFSGSALELFRQLDVPAAVANALGNLGRYLRLLGHHADAERHLRDARDLHRAIDQPAGLAEALEELARLDLARGRTGAALDLAEEAVRIADGRCDPVVRTSAHCTLGAARLASGSIPAAVEFHRSALALAEEAGVRIHQARAHVGLARTLGAANRPGAAYPHALRALGLSLSCGHPLEVATARTCVAQTALDRGVPQEAVAHAVQALAALDGVGHRRAEARGLIALARAEHALGRRPRAVALLDRARTRLDGSGVTELGIVTRLLDSDFAAA